MVDSKLLQEVAARYERYDLAATKWQRVHVSSRALILLLGVLSVAGPTLRMALRAENVLLAPLQPLEPVLGWVVLVVPALTALVTVMAGMFNAPRLWIAQRTGAESLKSEAFLYATGAEKYAAGNADATLRTRIVEVEQLVDDLQHGGGAA